MARSAFAWAVLALVFSGCGPPTSPRDGVGLRAAAAGETLWVSASGLGLKTKIYRSRDPGEHPLLTVVLHGDSPFGPPSYHYIFAREAASQIQGVVVAAVLRPGYADGTGDRSDGERGWTTGDNYTADVIDATNALVDQLKAKLGSRSAVLVGHSGGAAIAANMLGRHPSAAQGALLVSCPCDLTAWRTHMLKRQKNPVWLLPVRSLSPLDTAGSVAPGVRIRMLVGGKDDVAPPELTEKYAAALRARGVSVLTTIAPGLGHDILLEPIVTEQLEALVKSLPN